MTLDIYQVDAFTIGPFSGNPAAVIPLDTWLEDHILQSIALENNLSETAYILPEDEGYKIRWFTPAAEVDLCGHATLAAAKVVFEHLNYPSEKLTFSSRSGPLYISRKGDKIILNFPADEMKPAAQYVDVISAAIGIRPSDIWLGLSDYLCILESEEQVKSVRPDYRKLMQLEARGLIVSAQANQDSPYDIVSRCFFPQYGIDEDPVTGSAHTTIIPYWNKKLDRTTFEACQASYRGGLLTCEHLGDRVSLEGAGYLYMKGKIFI